ncbi:MAG: DUF4912 domain-containing protein [Elusimicrobiales bacterium]
MDTGQNTSDTLENSADGMWRRSLESRRDRLALLTSGPDSVLVYWEWTKTKADFFRKGSFSQEILITVFDAVSGAQACQFRRGWDGLRFYFKPPQRGLYYRAELAVFSASGETHCRLESNTVFVPRGAEGQ